MTPISPADAKAQRGTDELIPADELRRYIDSRINDLERSAQRSRWFFGVYVAVAWVVFAATFNAYLSWMRNIADDHAAEVLKGPGYRNVSQFLEERALDAWSGRLYVDIPVVGGQVHITDAGILVGLLVVLLATWVVFAARRENHLMFYLISDVTKYKFGLASMRYLKNQIHATQLLTPPSTTAALGPGDVLGKSTLQDRGRSIGIITASMYHAGPAALLFLFAADLWSLVRDTPLQAGKTVWDILVAKCGQDASVLTCSSTLDLAARVVVAFVLFVVAARLTWRAKSFQDQTHNLIAFLDAEVASLASRSAAERAANLAAEAAEHPQDTH